MRMSEIFEVDSGDHALHATIERRQAQAPVQTRNVWLIDRNTGKKVGGPFKDDEAAASFKKNRPDVIPSDARIRTLPPQ